MFTFFQILTHSAPLNGYKVPCKLWDPLCPGLFKEDISAMLAATLIAVISPFPFFSFFSFLEYVVFVCAFVNL